MAHVDPMRPPATVVVGQTPGAIAPADGSGSSTTPVLVRVRKLHGSRVFSTYVVEASGDGGRQLSTSAAFAEHRTPSLARRSQAPAGARDTGSSRRDFMHDWHLAARRAFWTLKTYRSRIRRDILAVLCRRAGHWITLASLLMSLLTTASDAADVRQSGPATESHGDALSSLGRGGRFGAAFQIERRDREHGGAVPGRVGHAVVRVLHDGFPETRPAARNQSEMSSSCGENCRSCLTLTPAEDHYRVLICVYHKPAAGSEVESAGHGVAGTWTEPVRESAASGTLACR